MTLNTLSRWRDVCQDDGSGCAAKEASELVPRLASARRAEQARVEGVSPASLFDWWFRDRASGRVVIVQFPNAALSVWLVASVLRSILGTLSRADMLRWVGGGALVAWGVDELLRGANPFRRFIGAFAVGYELWVIVRVLRGA